MAQEPINIVVLGPLSSGKTFLINNARAAVVTAGADEYGFAPAVAYTPTNGLNTIDMIYQPSMPQAMQVSGTQERAVDTVAVRITDTSGSERYQSLIAPRLQQAQAVIIFVSGNYDEAEGYQDALERQLKLYLDSININPRPPLTIVRSRVAVDESEQVRGLFQDGTYRIAAEQGINRDQMTFIELPEVPENAGDAVRQTFATAAKTIIDGATERGMAYKQAPKVPQQTRQVPQQTPQAPQQTPQAPQLRARLPLDTQAFQALLNKFKQSTGYTFSAAQSRYLQRKLASDYTQCFHKEAYANKQQAIYNALTNNDLSALYSAAAIPTGFTGSWGVSGTDDKCFPQSHKDKINNKESLQKKTSLINNFKSTPSLHDEQKSYLLSKLLDDNLDDRVALKRQAITNALKNHNTKALYTAVSMSTSHKLVAGPVTGRALFANFSPEQLRQQVRREL